MARKKHVEPEIEPAAAEPDAPEVATEAAPEVQEGTDLADILPPSEPVATETDAGAAESAIDDILNSPTPIEGAGSEPETEPVKKKRGRKPGGKNKPKDGTAAVVVQPTPAETAAAMVVPLGMTFRSAFSLVSRFRGEHWKLDDNEAKTLGEAWAPVVAPLLAENPGAILWVAAIGATSEVVGPRLALERATKGDSNDA